MKLAVLAILSLCLLTIRALPKCSTWQQDDQIQTDVVQLVNQQSQQQLCYTIKIDYSIPASGIQIAVGTLDLNKYSSKHGIDYSVRAKKHDFSNSITLALLVHDKTWTKVDVSYLATSRSDIIAGSFIADTFPLFGCDRKSTDSGVVKHSLPALSQGKYQIAAFISGIKTRDPQHKIKIQAYVNSQYIEISITSTAFPLIQNVHIDYVLVSIYSPLHLVRFNNLNVRSSQFIAGAIEIGVFQVRQIAGLGLGHQKIICVGYVCPKDCVDIETCKQKGGIITNNQCHICSKHQKFWGGKCIPHCDDNEYFENGYCYCKQGYQKINEKCVLTCSEGEYWNGKQCVCKVDFGRYRQICKPCPRQSFKQKCLCPSGQLWNSQNWKCIPKCNNWEIWNGKQCVCEKGYGRNKFGKCKPCPKDSNGLGDRCYCPKGSQWNEDRWDCVYNCNSGQIWNGKQCVCDNGLARFGNMCKPCPKGSTQFNDKCICTRGFNWNQSKWTCIPQCGQWQQWKGDKCVCQSGCGRHHKYCKPCPEYAKAFNQKCICQTGYSWIDDKWACIPQCPRDQYWNGKSCVCKGDLILMNGQCKQCPPYSVYHQGQCKCNDYYEWNGPQWRCDPHGPVCPPRSTWNQKKLECQCDYSTEHLIDGLCRKCGRNQGWNGQECVCVSNYYKIKGVCRTCDPNSTFNGRDCICNHGFYGDADKCDKCHPSCGKCSGPWKNQCLSCSDVSYDLVNGECTRNIPCPTGLFLDKDSCKPCSSYCQTCQSETVCDTCIEGFQLHQMNFMGVKASYCSEICGDGKRFELQCDDNNTKNNDGCNKYCEVEKGWHCQGGSSIKPSTCVPFIPDRSYITTTGTVHLYGKVVQGVRLSYIPPQLTNSQCARCSQILWVRVIDSSIVPGVRISYLPKSKYQFLIEFQFNALLAIPVFSVSIQINPKFEKDFSAADMAQIQIKKIDPATLKKNDVTKQLSLSDIQYSDDVLDEIFGDE